MSDKEYEPEMDGPSKGSDWTSLVCNGLVPSTHESLIKKLQVVHDQIEPSRWRSTLRSLAKNFGLKYDLKKYVK